MNVNPISTNVNFDGKVIINGKISKAQNKLLSQNKGLLESMIKKMPFDLIIKQSRSKKTLLVSTNVDDAQIFTVKNRKQTFAQTADLAISDGKQKSKTYKRIEKIKQMFEYRKQSFLNVLIGNFKEAKKNRQELAKLAIENFEDFKTLPKINFTNTPKSIIKTAIFNGFKYRLYSAFTSKTPEEKALKKMSKEYLKELKANKKQIKTINIPFPYAY